MAYEPLEGSYQAAPGSAGAYDRLLRNIEDEFEQLQRYQSRLNKANDHGTPKPSEVHEATSAAKDGAACISKLRNLVGTELRRAASDASGQQKRERSEKQRELTKRFKAASKQFTQSVKATQGLSQRSSAKTGGATAPRAGESAGGSAQEQEQEQLLNSHAIDHQRAMAREREEESRRLAGEMATLQDIMGDLNQQVAVQGEMIDDIETNATSAEDRADKGVEHLEKASTYQKVFTSRAMWLVAVLVILGGGVAAAVVLTHKK